MKDYLNEILPKLSGVMTNEERLTLFNQTFHKVLEDNAGNVNCPIIDEDGNIHIENLKRITDKLGMGSLDFYRKEKDETARRITGKCIKIPSKDMLLLIAVCLELDTDAAHTLLRAAGYGDYLKNLKEFIIFCGLNNIKSIDDVSSKLFQYGFREQSALMTVSYHSEKDIIKKFSEYFTHLCNKKDYDKKKILERAGLVSAQLDPEKNKYYYNAFYGQKSVKIILNHKQVLKLFAALDLSVSEKMEYLGFLLDLDVVHEDSVKLLLDAVNADANADAGNYSSANPQSVDHNSVFTHYISTKMDHLYWDQLDGFIEQTFSSIRSFAVFYNQLILYEGFRNVADFCNEYELSTKSHYNYVLGITLPELTTLTAFTFLFKKMSIQIYNTLLKKAGKYIFDNNEDSIVYIIAKELLVHKTSGVPAFGDLYDLVESLVATSENNQEYLYEDLGEMYLELVKILSRNLLGYAKSAGFELKPADQAILKTLAENLMKSHVMNYSDYFGRLFEADRSANADGFIMLLKEKFGFSDDSALIVSLNRQLKSQVGKAAMDNRVPLKRGDTLFLSNDTYTIHRLLARGGTSLIYEGERLYCDQEDSPKRCFSKKVLLKELAPLRVQLKRSGSGELIFMDADISSMKRLFENEIDCLATIQARNTENNRIPDMDSFGDYNNTVYIAMNHIKGDLLSEYIGRRRMTDKEIRIIFTQILRVVGFLHGIDQGYSHLDLKPQNFIVDALDTVYLFDFGSSLIEDDTWVNNYTEDYSAPEVVYNMLDKVDQRSDIYSLGAILFEMVTGERASMDRFLLCGDRYCAERFCTRYDYNALLSRMLTEDVNARFDSVKDAAHAFNRMYEDKK